MKTNLVFAAVLLLTGCGERTSKESSLTKWEGREVTVQFRRDLLGAAGSPVSPTATWVNNAMVSLKGTLVEASPDGVFLDSHYKLNVDDAEAQQSIFWIPKVSILMVKLEER